MTRATKSKTSLGELRGILLVVFAIAALLHYYSWWFVDGRLTSVWLVAAFIFALFYGIFQLLGSWIVYLGTHHRARKLPAMPSNLTVDVFVTAYNEDYSMIERCLTAACEMQGPHKTWLLDDGDDPELDKLAEKLNVGYLTRDNRKDAKAGNLNAAFPRTEGDIIAIFDVDHIPKPDFLQRTIGYFTDDSVGFVQVMPTFYNNHQGWVARAAAETSLDFYNPTSLGMDGMNSVTKMGTNSLIRRKALESIGGYQPGLAEDLETSISLHAAGWKSRYVAEPLAPGLSPQLLSAWFTQQLKWSRGVFEVMITKYPRLFTKLTWGQRISYGVRTTKYLIGPIIGMHIILLIAVLFSGDETKLATTQQYFIHLIPVAFMDWLIRGLALRRWRHTSVLYETQWRAIVLVFASWPIYTVSWLMVLLRLPLSFRPTPKETAGRINPVWIMPQLVSAFLILARMVYSINVTQLNLSRLLLYVIATSFVLLQIGLLRPMFRSIFVSPTGHTTTNVKPHHSRATSGHNYRVSKKHHQ